MMLHNTTVKISQDGGTGEKSEIEKTLLCHPLLLQDKINEGGRRKKEEEDRMKVGAR